MRQVPNVTFVGIKPQSQLPTYIRHASCCLIPFTMDSVTEFVNPLKVYEYLAMARPVVSSALPELARSNVAPLGLALPWGLIAGIPIPHVPLPVKIHTRVLRPLHLGLPREAASDPDEVERAFARIVARMEAGLGDLRAAGRHGLFPRG